MTVTILSIIPVALMVANGDRLFFPYTTLRRRDAGLKPFIRIGYLETARQTVLRGLSVAARRMFATRAGRRRTS